MTKPSEILDTPAATGFSRVGGSEEIIANAIEKEGSYIDDYNKKMFRRMMRTILTTKDQEKEEAVKKAYEAGKKSFLKDISKIDHSVLGKRVSYITYDEVGTIDWDKVKAALPTEDNN